MSLKLFVAVAFAVLAVCSAGPQEFYPSDFDNYDVDVLIKDPSKLKAFKECVFANGHCSDFARHFKQHFADALLTNCIKCTNVQKVHAKQIIKALQHSYPEDFERTIKKVDPEHKHWPIFEKTVLAH